MDVGVLQLDQGFAGGVVAVFIGFEVENEGERGVCLFDSDGVSINIIAGFFLFYLYVPVHPIDVVRVYYHF